MRACNEQCRKREPLGRIEAFAVELERCGSWRAVHISCLAFNIIPKPLIQAVGANNICSRGAWRKDEVPKGVSCGR